MTPVNRPRRGHSRYVRIRASPPQVFPEEHSWKLLKHVILPAMQVLECESQVTPAQAMAPDHQLQEALQQVRALVLLLSV